MLYSDIIAVCSEIHTKHINTLCGQNVEFVNVKPGGTYSNPLRTKALPRKPQDAQQKSNKHNLDPKQIKEKIGLLTQWMAYSINRTVTNGLRGKLLNLSQQTTCPVCRNVNRLNAYSSNIRLHALLSCRSCCRMCTAVVLSAVICILPVRAGLQANRRSIPSLGTN
jgi:hypothetical protein